MFASARIKLTAWYLLIIMMISIVFSVVIYRILTIEIERGLRIQRIRIEQPDTTFLPSSPPYVFRDPQLLEEIKQRIRLNLLFINISILGISGGFGFFLAGRTLKPIEIMVDEQKQFVADASHELRTPLTSIKTSIEVALRDKKLNFNDTKALLKSNLEDVDKMNVFANHLLKLSRYQNVSLKLDFQKIQVNDIVKSAIENIKTLAKKKSIRIETEKSVNGTIYGNEATLRELFTILLDNSVKYSNENSVINIHVKVEKKFVIVAVQDYGIGIKSDEIPLIFKRFYRADASRTKTNVEGYGLGLSIAKRIVELHKGRIEVSSLPGKQTVFTVYLPHQIK